MNLEVDKTVKIAIGTGIISTIICTYFIDPIFTLIGRVMLYIGSRFMNAYLDNLYSEIAAGEMNYGFIGLTVIMLIPIGSTISALVYFIIDSVKKRKESEETKINIKMRVLCGILSVLAAMFIIGDGYLRLKISSTYNQQLTILAPHITDQKYKELRANYASMKSENDYQNLRHQMDNIAKEKNLKLPLNSLYP